MGKAPPPKKGYDQIDESLRRAFNEVLDEGVPDRFSDLLKKLKSGDIPESPDASDDGSLG